MRFSPPRTSFQPACGCGVCPQSTVTNTGIIMNKRLGLRIPPLIDEATPGRRMTHADERDGNLSQLPWTDQCAGPQREARQPIGLGNQCERDQLALVTETDRLPG